MTLVLYTIFYGIKISFLVNLNMMFYYPIFTFYVVIDETGKAKHTVLELV
jgi:hypothetical protein